MATVTKNQIRSERKFSAPYGNAYKGLFTFEVNASGVFVDSDKATAVASGDVVRICTIQAGTRLDSVLAIVSDAFAASTTAKLGFAYVDGVDSTEVPQDDDYFFAALATSSAGRTLANNTAVRPVTLPKDAYLILTRGGAADSAAGIVDFIVDGVLTGAE